MAKPTHTKSPAGSGTPKPRAPRTILRPLAEVEQAAYESWQGQAVVGPTNIACPECEAQLQCTGTLGRAPQIPQLLLKCTECDYSGRVLASFSQTGLAYILNLRLG
jgi:hypothetical protein